jgi:hypothetical protein
MSSNWRNLTSGLLDQCVKAFGVTATYSPLTGDDYEVDGVFDRPFLKIEAGQDNSHLSSAPSFGVNESDMENTPVEGDEVTIEGTVYKVFEVQPDKQGHIKLLLHEA